MSAMAWLSREEMVALGWALLHFCWQGTAVAVVFAVVDRMTSRTTSRVRYVVALAALMLMPVVVIGTFAEEMRAVTPARVNGTDFRTIPAVHLGVNPVPILHELPLASSLEEPMDWLKIFAERLLPWVDALWLAGVLLLAVRSLGGWWQLDQVRRRARTMVPEEVARGFQRISERIHVGRQVALRISDEVISPLAMGVWRATVILPVSAVSGLPKDELEAVIAHELGHIRRCDYVWNLAQTAIESTLFFHPAVWWVSRTVRERREACCDEIAVQSCAGATVYARALLRLEEQRTRKLQLALALGGCGGSLLQRVRKVLGEESAMEDRMTSGVSVATAGALVLALLLGPKVGLAVAAPVVAVMHPAAPVAEASPAPQTAAVDTPVAVHASAKPTESPAIYSPLPPSAKMPMVIVSATAQVSPQVVVSPDVAVNVAIAPATIIELQEPNGATSPKGAVYLDGMRDAGYPLDLNNDLNTLVSLKSLGVTPEYAKAMGATGLGKPTVHELISLKSMGVTPEYVAALRKSGIAPKDFHEVVTEKSLGITPDYAAEMKQKGFGDLSVHELVTMKSLGVTTEYAASMKQAGFGDLSVHELISLKAQGMTPEYARWLKQQFPQATTEELRRAAVFHLNDKFVADAKAHGFDGKDLNKLLKLKMSGLLDE
jgi:beta-lactamase regulating signal transducer with metallopeptidase domain